MKADQNTERDAIEVPDFSATKLFQSANKQTFENAGMITGHVNIEDLISDAAIGANTNAKETNYSFKTS